MLAQHFEKRVLHKKSLWFLEQMTEKKSTTHVLIARQLLIAQREHSSIWQCRYSIDGRWQRTSTGERDMEKAKLKAHELLMEANVRKRMNVAPITRYFKDVAQHAIKRMKDELAGGGGKVSYKDYIVATDKYLIPILGKYHVDSIDQNVLAVLDERRSKMMRKVPTRSTLLTHNVALNRIFDEAEYKGYMTKTQRPILKAKGKKTERRPEFSVHEIKAIRGNVDKWIDRGRADSVPIRALMKEYIECLIDTGARAGKELLDLKWTQLELQYSPIEHKTGEIVADEFEPEGYEVSHVDLRQVVFINIQTGKTGMRQIVGRAPTVRALRHIARANYDMTLDQLIKNGLDEYIFTYREVLSKEEKQTDQEAKLRRPTSFDKLFHTYLKEHNLDTDPVTKKNRPLYCLRHTYATQALTNDRVNPHTLAKQMGTSIGMIERHYSHLIPKQAVEQLRGEQTRQLMNASGFDDKRYAFDEKKEKKPRSKKKVLKDN